MRRTVTALSISAALAAAGVAVSEAPRVLDELVEAERAFAAAALADGMRASFLAYSADEAVVFRPGSVRVREWFRERPDPAGRLLWSPATAEVSFGGDLGYTFGPWRFVDEGEETVATGQFFTVWQRQADGAWRWLVDIGTVHPPEEPAAPLELKVPRDRAPASAEGGSVAGPGDGLEAAERAFAAATAGAEANGYRAHGAADLVLLRQGAPPARGRGAALAVLAGRSGATSWRTESRGVARSADLGFTRGTVEWSPAGPGGEGSMGSFVRVWRRAPGGRWEIAVDAVIPLPPSEP